MNQEEITNCKSSIDLWETSCSCKKDGGDNNGKEKNICYYAI